MPVQARWLGPGGSLVIPRIARDRRSLQLTSETTYINMAPPLQGMQKAVKWYPPAYDIRVEQVPIPR